MPTEANDNVHLVFFLWGVRRGGWGGRRSTAVTYSPKTKNVPGTRYRTSSALSALGIFPCPSTTIQEGSWMIARHYILPPNSTTDTAYGLLSSLFSLPPSQDFFWWISVLLQGVFIGRTSYKNYWRIYWPGQSVDYHWQ